MSDRLTPPPEEPMDEATRQRIRQRLAHPLVDHEPHHRWWLPVAAAVAVLAIALGTGFAAMRPPGDQAPAGPGGTGPSPTEPSRPPAIPSRPPGAPVSEAYCVDPVARQLPGAERVVSWEQPGGAAGIWVAGERSVFCEFSGGVATLHRVRPTVLTGTPGPEQLGFSTTSYRMSSEQPVVSFIAGGPLPQGVTGIDYAFPDGHVESAVLRTDDAGRRWWAMAYVPSEGPLADPRLNLLRLDPVRVIVSSSDVQNEVVLQWGRDECAQVNHGC